ncbi:hypothetical protein GPECTOR_11g125 [Gonium pectorale]|uniref:Uncharacterized protein n=1 Tax=Gonium pectorale TaxID=33097 RepID=A0A150GPB1_GONPE|nr:hypothetical protein GPECTOR_11g125 [Gonium pectorale]|eukprot:KXZ51673.1 hypothetical protein GPECTOR_11g125 [Gonium pectorale]
MAAVEGDSVKDGASQSPRGDQRPGSSVAEVLRLKDIIKMRDKELDDARKEVMALKASLNTKDRELANMAKEMAALKVEKRKLETQVGGLVRRGDKEQSMPVILAQEKAAAAAAAASNGNAAKANGLVPKAEEVASEQLAAPAATASGPTSAAVLYGGTSSRASNSGGGSSNPVPGSEEVAALQADLRMARMDGEKAQENVKALENVLRAKDKQIAMLQRKADETDVIRAKCYEFENKTLGLQKQLEDLRAQGKSSADMLRGRDVDKSRVLAELEKTKQALELSQDAVARSSAALKASEVRCAALETEVGTLVSQLARTSVVAQRVAVAEVKAGCKDEGMVHVTRHLEEVRFMGGEIGRLQERIGQLERELAAANDGKVPGRRLSAVGASILGSPGSPARRISQPNSRPSSRPSSAPRRPFTSASSASTTTIGGGGAVRPNSAPRSRSAVRASTNSIPAGAAAAVAAAAGEKPATSAAAGAARGTGLALSTVRSSFSGALRRSPRPQPWETPSPSKAAAGAVASNPSSGSPKAATTPPSGSKPSVTGVAPTGGAPQIKAHPLTGVVRPASAGSKPAAAKTTPQPAKASSIKSKGLPMTGASPVKSPKATGTVAAGAAQQLAVEGSAPVDAPQEPVEAPATPTADVPGAATAEAPVVAQAGEDAAAL